MPLGSKWLFTQLGLAPPFILLGLHCAHADEDHVIVPPFSWHDGRHLMGLPELQVSTWSITWF